MEAKAPKCSILVLIGIAALLSLGGVLAGLSECDACYPYIFAFGDSLSDTGNGALTNNFLFRRATQRPYGQTYPGSPAARFSDGRLLIDYIAEYVGLPLLSPYLNTSGDFSTGVSYAVAGATALTPCFLNSMIIFPQTPYSLDTQVSWHFTLKSSAPAPNKPALTDYTNGLYVLEFGGNDYLAALQAGSSPTNVASTLVPMVINKIKNATEVLYASGARIFLYISITPLGCASSLLATYPFAAKDKYGCIEQLNSLSETHGDQLLNLVKTLPTTLPNGTFIFLNYYDAYMNVLQNATSFGFTNTLDACCGAGPLFPYRYNIGLFCNSLSNTQIGTLCTNPNLFLNWDGLHFTEKFNYQILNQTFITGAYVWPPNAFAACN